jgi:hypothetical protein
MATVENQPLKAFLFLAKKHFSQLEFGSRCHPFPSQTEASGTEVADFPHKVQIVLPALVFFKSLQMLISVFQDLFRPRPKSGNRSGVSDTGLHGPFRTVRSVLPYLGNVWSVLSDLENVRSFKLLIPEI